MRVRQSLLGAFLQFADTFCIRGLSGPSGIRGKVGSEPGIRRGGAASNRRRSASGDEEVAMKRQCVETEDGVEADEVVGEVAEGVADSVVSSMVLLTSYQLGNRLCLYLAFSSSFTSLLQ